MKPLIVLLSVQLAVSAALAGQPARKRAVVGTPPPMERLLVPMAGELLEPGDAYWYADLVVKNDNPVPILVFYPFPCQITQCLPPPPFTMQPGDNLGNMNNSLLQAFLSVERSAVDGLAYSLRVRDVSSFSLPVLGTELPLVRERDFRSSVHLVNLPIEPANATVMLRIYGLGVTAADVDVEVLADTLPYRHEVSFSHETVTLKAGGRVSGFDAFPAWGVVDLRPRLSPALPQKRFSLRVSSLNPDVKIWAFVLIHEPGVPNPTIVTPGR